MGGAGFGDQPVIPAVDPGVKPVLTNEINRLVGDVGWQGLLLQDGSIPLDEKSAIKAGNRRIELEGVEQHGHAERRTAAGDREADAGIMQPANGGFSAWGQHLVLGYE